MNARTSRFVFAMLLAVMLGHAADAGAQSQQQAARQAARQHDAQVLSARTVKNANGRQVHHIKLLTKDGRVKNIKVPDRRKPKNPD